jgi:MGT family glycosyltransferase
MATIGLLTVPMAGHLRPALRAGARLAAAGHRVLAFGPAGAAGIFESAGIEPRILHQLPGAGPAARPRHDTVIDEMPVVAVGTAERAERHVEHVTEALLAESVDLVFHDAQAPWGRIAAEWLGLPRICSFPLFPFSLTPPPSGPPAQPQVDPELIARLDATREAVVRRWAIEIGGFGELVTNLGDATIAYTTEQILGALPPEDHWCMVGPLLGRTERPHRARQKAVPRVYAALGTLYNRRPEPFLTMVEALAPEADLLVSTGGGLAPERLGALPASVEVVRWVDPQQALAGADVHITHGGGSSVHEALVAGVPMICLPQGSDQVHWARRVEELGAGVVLDDFSAAGLREAFRRIVEDEAISARAAELARHLRDYDGEARLLNAVEQLVG